MNIINDVYNFFKSLSAVDIIFLVAIISLLILIVTLLYFININKEILGEDDLLNIPEDDNSKNDINIIESIKTPDSSVNQYNDEEGELLDLESLTKKLQEEEKTGRVNLTNYEKDQEEKAIISYDELLAQKDKYAINYEKEEVVDDIIIKKVDLNDLSNKSGVIATSSDAHVISYQKEEDFLKALKELNSLLN